MTLPVLCYHRIGGPPELGVTRVSQAVFTRQMESLARAGWRTLQLSEFAAARPTSHAPRRFLLTFDDGYESLAEHAYPVLERLGFTASTFVITDFVGRENRWDMRYTWRRLRHLDWVQIEQWQARGFEFASHGARHRRLTWVDDVTATDELGRAREVLIRRLGAEAGRAIAYPFGAVDNRVQRLAREAGYELGFGGVRGDHGSPWNVPRVPVYMWDATDTPFGLRQDGLGAVGRFVAHVANRCAIGTSMMQAARGRIVRPPESAADA
ncbi:MAG TPA: polysaccharide deacetylase family protein [Gemmatimonadales bacterium]|nr:polysaccharide deacetylase family protein [Gemmatimonadales bacterium]